MSPWIKDRGNRCLLAGTALALVWLGLVSRIHVNSSWSDDAWGYFVMPMGTPERGDVVVFEPPEALRATVPYLKTVRGVPGDRITVDGDRGVWVNHEYLGRAKPFSLNGRALEAIDSGTVPDNHYFMHADHADSHDSRYSEIGLVSRGRISGRALALPDIPWLGLELPLVEPGTGPADAGAPEREMDR